MGEGGEGGGKGKIKRVIRSDLMLSIYVEGIGVGSPFDFPDQQHVQNHSKAYAVGSLDGAS